jgi:hypothetical protein
MTPTSPRSYYHQTFPLIPAWRGALRFSNDPVKSADFRFWHKADVERTFGWAQSFPRLALNFERYVVADLMNSEC